MLAQQTRPRVLPLSPTQPSGGPPPKLARALSPFGFVVLGFGSIFGTSWLILTGVWESQGGGPLNALLAWVLVAVLELPLVLAYLEAVPMLPRAGGEMSYVGYAFGRFAGFIAGWFGVIVNLIVCAYELVALIVMTQVLWPSVTNNPWYKISGSPVGLLTILIDLAVVVVIAVMHHRGVHLSSNFLKLTTVAILLLAAAGVITALLYGSWHNMTPWHTKPTFDGMIAVVTMLPFSLAGWESIAKGTEESRRGLPRGFMGKAVPLSWGMAAVAYILTMLAVGFAIPWEKGQNAAIPLVSGLNQITGSPVMGKLMIVAALIGCIAVYNALLFAITRQTMAMARAGLVPRFLSHVNPRFKTPTNTIWWSSALIAIAAFIGISALVPLVDAASFAYIVVWGGTFLAVVKLRQKAPMLARPNKVPLKSFEWLGFVAIFAFAAMMLYPKSPGALTWPNQYGILLGLIALGIVLYFLRPRNQAGIKLADIDFDAFLAAGGAAATLGVDDTSDLGTNGSTGMVTVAASGGDGSSSITPAANGNQVPVANGNGRVAATTTTKGGGDA